MERYEVFDSLGRNHFSEAFDGYDTQAAREVAIVQFHSSFFARPDRATAVWNDILAAIRVTDRNLVAVHDVDEANRRIVTEKMEGNLQMQIATEGLRPSLVRSILRQTLEGLVAIHDAGRLHGDVKPGQILYNREGRIQLGFSPGFFIGGTVPSRPDDPMHQTPESIKPEVFGEIGPASDLYMTGFAMAEVLAGPDFQRHFDGAGHDPQMIFARWHGDPNRTLPSLAQIVPSVPDDLCKVVDRMLQKPVTQRFQSAGEVLAALEDAPVERIEVTAAPLRGMPEPLPPKRKPAANSKFDSPDYVQSLGSSGETKQSNFRDSATGSAVSDAPTQSVREWLDNNLQSPIAKAAVLGVMGVILATVALLAFAKPGQPVVDDDSNGFEPFGIASLAITPSTAKIFLGDERLEPDAELGGVQLPLGDHTLRIVADGYETMNYKIDVDEQGTADDLKMKPADLLMTIVGLEESDEIVVDGSPVTIDAKTSVVTLSPGKHQLVARRQLHADIDKEIELAIGEKSPEIELEWEQVEAIVEVALEPENASLSLEGKTLAPQPNDDRQFALPLGIQSFLVDKEGFAPQTVKFDVVSGKNSILEVSLEPAKMAKPDSKQITIEEAPLGVDTVQLSIEGGTDTEWQLETRGKTYNFKGPTVSIPKSTLVEQLEGDEVAVLVKVKGRSDFEAKFTREQIEDGVIKIFRSVMPADNARFKWLFARQAIRSGTAEIAETQLDEAIELDDEKYQFFRDRAIARATQGKTNIAKKDFEKAKSLPGGSQDFYLLQEYAILLAGLGDIEACVRTCNEALAIRDHATGPRLLRAQLAFRAKNYDAALRDAGKLWDESYDKEQLSYAKNLIGLVMLKGGDVPKAFESFMAAVNLDPTNSSAHLNVGKTARQLAIQLQGDERVNKLEVAMSAYKNALKISPNLEEQVLSLVAQLEYDAGDARSAIVTLTSLMQKYGQTAKRLSQRSAIYKTLGMNEEAMKDEVRAGDLN